MNETPNEHAGVNKQSDSKNTGWVQKIARGLVSRMLSRGRSSEKGIRSFDQEIQTCIDAQGDTERVMHDVDSHNGSLVQLQFDAYFKKMEKQFGKPSMENYVPYSLWVMDEKFRDKIFTYIKNCSDEGKLFIAERIKRFSYQSHYIGSLFLEKNREEIIAFFFPSLDRSMYHGVELWAGRYGVEFSVSKEAMHMLGEETKDTGANPDYECRWFRSMKKIGHASDYGDVYVNYIVIAKQERGDDGRMTSNEKVTWRHEQAHVISSLMQPETPQTKTPITEENIQEKFDDGSLMEEIKLRYESIFIDAKREIISMIENVYHEPLIRYNHPLKKKKRAKSNPWGLAGEHIQTKIGKNKRDLNKKLIESYIPKYTFRLFHDVHIASKTIPEEQKQMIHEYLQDMFQLYVQWVKNITLFAYDFLDKNGGYSPENLNKLRSTRVYEWHTLMPDSHWNADYFSL